MNETSPLARSFAPSVAIGTVQGILLWWLSGSIVNRTWPATNPTLYPMLLLLTIYLPPTIYLMSEWSNRLRAWQVISLIAAMLLGASAHYGSHIEPVELSTPYTRYSSFPLLLTVFVWLFHAIPFAQAWLATDAKWPAYPQLFLYAWRNALQLALAALFTGVFWILLWVWIELFDMLNIHFPKVLFSQDGRFSLLVAAIVFAAGYHLAGSTDRLLLALRQQVLALLKWLALVATLILILFALALLIRAPVLMASHRHLISATWLLWLAVITIYLYNAGYQNGDTPEPYPAPIGRLLRYSTPLLILITAMALYALYVRSEAYGLTVSRVWGFFIAVIAFAYALTYTIAACRSKPWMGFVGSANVAIALLLLFMLALLLSPLMAPERLSAQSLADRLLRNPQDVTGSDLMVLQFDDGVYGKAKLQALTSSSNVPLREAAVAALSVTPTARYIFNYPKVDGARLVLRAFPAGAQIDTDLRAAIASGVPTYPFIAARVVDPPTPDSATGEGHYAGPCPPSDPCPVLFVNLSEGADQQAVAFWAGGAHVYQRRGGHWKSVAAFEANCRACAKRELLHDLESGSYQAIASPWKDLQIGKNVIVITERHLDDSHSGR